MSINEAMVHVCGANKEEEPDTCVCWRGALSKVFEMPCSHKGPTTMSQPDILLMEELRNFQTLQFKHSFGAFVIAWLLTSENAIFLTH